MPNTHDAKANQVLAEHPAIVADLLKADEAALRCYAGHFPPSPPACAGPAFNALRQDVREAVKYHPFAETYQAQFGKQLDECGSSEIAGDKPTADRCRLETVNAADYLIFLGLGSHNPPMVIWLGCATAGESSFATQARCMIAALNIEVRAYYPDGRMAHDADCRMMYGNWEANPQARAMRFDGHHPLFKSAVSSR